MVWDAVQTKRAGMLQQSEAISNMGLTVNEWPHNPLCIQEIGNILFTFKIVSSTTVPFMKTSLGKYLHPNLTVALFYENLLIETNKQNRQNHENNHIF